jgi:GH15 family glucan-1,4-alpha-glucosidase
MVNRSLLVLKLLTFQPTGAIAAAATTSLPEVIGGERNWDYRFSWIRDASFTLKALFNLGHISEADGFIHWLHKVYKKYGSHNLQIMYSLSGRRNIAEKALSHLKGYKDSRPVRIGNKAFRQEQWDIFGEIMDSALRLSDYVGKIDENLWPFFRDICNLAIESWQKPDYGIWEVRNGPFHFVHSKAMCWVALDRGIKIAKRYGFDAPLDKWKMDAKKIKNDILKKGYNNKIKSFVQCYASD